MADPFIGEIRAFPYNFAPRSWAFCEGQILPIAQNTALFSLLGTTFGGDGQSTFALPDLRGRVPIGAGRGSGLSDRVLGTQLGSATVQLATNQLPSHSHLPVSSTAPADSYGPVGNRPARTDRKLYSSTPPDTAFDASAVVPTGGGLAHENRQPLLAIGWCIALAGIYPPRD